MRIRMKSKDLQSAIDSCRSPIMLKVEDKYICIGIVESIDAEQYFYANCTMSSYCKDYGILNEEDWIIAKYLHTPIFESQDSKESDDCILLLLEKIGPSTVS